MSLIISEEVGPRMLKVEVSIPEQRLWLFEGGRVVSVFMVSTAKNGPGELMNSECTPRGEHVIRAKVGEGCPINTVFVGRRPTGEIFGSELHNSYPDRDWILTRILWLSGIEPSKNRLGNVDSMRRYIYIHGCPDDVSMGTPSSHGCIRMRSEDVVMLFNSVETGTRVAIRG